jgi:hypothetical protein
MKGKGAGIENTRLDGVPPSVLRTHIFEVCGSVMRELGFRGVGSAEEFFLGNVMALRRRPKKCAVVMSWR